MGSRRVGAFGIGCATIGVTLATLGTPVAQADDQSFLAAVRVVGFAQSSDVLLRTGRSACYALRRSDPPLVATRVQRFTAVTEDQANQFLALAVNEFCPQYRG